MISLKVNGKDYEVDVPPDTPLLWVIREDLGLTGKRVRRLPVDTEQLKKG